MEKEQTGEETPETLTQEAPETPGENETPPEEIVIPAAEIPPAAAVVIKGTRTEREQALEKELRQVQTRAAELEDENRSLKTPRTRPAPAILQPETKRRFLDGATFFEE